MKGTIMKGMNDEKYSLISFFADGNPVPELMTEKEAIKFLRLDDGNTKRPELTLQYYRSEGRLRGTRVGKRIRYQKSELMRFFK